jgi:adenylate cyclase
MMGFVLQLFGGFRLSPKEGDSIGLTDRAHALLAYLAVAPAPVPRKRLAELLSEVGIEQDQRAAFRQTLYLARKAASVIVSNRKGELVLNKELVEADVKVFQSALTNDDRCYLQTAVELYRGPFLDGIKSPSSAFEEWLQARRAEFLEGVVEALLKLAGLDTAAGLHSSGLAYARRALALDPLREDAHRQVMCCLAALGQRTNALRQYEIAQRLLAEELGVLPEAKTTALHDTIARGEGVKEGVAQVVLDRNIEEGTGGRIRLLAFIGSLSMFAKTMAALTITFPLIAGGSAIWYAQRPESSSSVPSIAVLPFANAGGSPPRNLGTADEIATMLSTHPGIQVVSIGKTATDAAPNAQQRYHALGARYVLKGSVQNSAGKIQVMVQLIDAATGDHLWADRLHEEGDDIAALEEQVAYRIYESIVGFSGEIERHEQRQAWLKSDLSLDEYDYARRGGQFYFQFTREAHAKARQIWNAGLAKFPNSAITRASLASLYRHAVEVGWSEHPDQDLNKAWQLGREASLTAHRSRYEEWMSHVLMAKLSQWCKEDFERSVAEAKSAVKLVPYDATIRADLAELMANAGKTDEAVEWLQESIKRDPKGPEWYTGNLAWAYYLAGRYKDALAELQKLNKPRPLLLSAVYINLGRIEEAQAVMRDFLNKNPNHTLADAARWPLIASLKRSWLEDLRQAGLAEIR